MGSGTGVAAHPVAQLKQEDNTVQLSLQSTHRPHHSRTHSFHTIYDGDGRRVKKITALETTIFVYNASGQLVAEYSTQTAQTPQVSYLTTDHLGSARVITNENGAVSSRRDYTAFGEESITAERAAGLGYTSSQDGIRKGYTGYEKDIESGLDFAQARYYNSVHGRFTSVDPLTASASIRNPQTFNRYSYVLNSPYKYVDPLGLIARSAIAGSTEADGLDRRWTTKDCTKGCAIDGKWYEPVDFQNSPPPDPPPAQDADQNAEPPVTVPDPASLDPFVISNAAAFFDGLASNPGYQDAAGISQCALLPLDWENSQDSYLDKIQGDSTGRKTENWVKGAQVTDNMGIAQGTVLASGWDGNSYRSRPSGSAEGNHVVVFDRFDTKDGQRGMWVAEQLANKNGKPVRSFKAFNSGGNYFSNAGAFHIVRIVRPAPKVGNSHNINVLRRVLQE